MEIRLEKYEDRRSNGFLASLSVKGATLDEFMEQIMDAESDYRTQLIHEEENKSLRNEVLQWQSRALGAEENNRRLQENEYDYERTNSRLKKDNKRLQEKVDEVKAQNKDLKADLEQLDKACQAHYKQVMEYQVKVAGAEEKLERLQRLHNALQESYDQVYDERDLLKDTIEAIDIIRGRERKIVQEMKDEGDDLTTPYAPC